MRTDVSLDDFDFDLPGDRIAQEPPAERDGGRMLVVHRAGTETEHRRVTELPDFLGAGDLLVVNTTRVVPARLRGRKPTGGAVEALVLGPDAGGADRWRALVRGAGRLREGQKLRFSGNGCEVETEVAALHGDGEVTLHLPGGESPYRAGETPLPPYIRRTEPRSADRARYQTVFARRDGAVAAPTAGLHLSHTLLDRLTAGGVERADVVLHVGPGTFRPIGDAELRRGRLHEEAYALSDETAERVDSTRRRGGRIVAVGTTVARVLETCARPDGRVRAASGSTDLFLRPGSRFRVVDALLTNFHLPRSSLLLLVAAFAGKERVLAAYAEAIRRDYRFYSYGDAMLLL